MTKETIIDVSKQFRNLQVQYDKVVEQNKQLQQERMWLINNYDFINTKFKRLLSIFNKIVNFLESVKKDKPDYEPDYVPGKILKIMYETEEVENDR